MKHLGRQWLGTGEKQQVIKKKRCQTIKHHVRIMQVEKTCKKRPKRDQGEWNVSYDTGVAFRVFDCYRSHSEGLVGAAMVSLPQQKSMVS